MVLPSPSAFFDSWNIHWIYSEGFLLAKWISSRIRLTNHTLEFVTVKLVIVYRQFFDLLDYELFLLFDYVAYFGVVYCWVDKTLHHGSSFVVFYISFPSFRWHPALFAETLLSKISQSQIVSICHEILNLSSLHLLYITSKLPLSLFISLVPNPLICSVEVIARKAI